MNKILAILGSAATLSYSVVTFADPVPDFTALVEKTAPAVVSVEVQSAVEPSGPDMLAPGMPDIFKYFFGIPPQRFPGGDPFHGQADPRGDQGAMVRKSEGSGFIIDKTGYILTNAHVVDGADAVQVLLKDRKEYQAKVVGLDKLTDIALLKISGKNLPVATLGDSDKVKVGDWVLAIGSPFGFTTTATQGIVSALGRSLPSETYTAFIQTDAAINPGNSGGPLFNGKGEVIGINAQIYTRSGAFNGIGFAIPINVAKSVADQIKSKGKVERGWLGVVIQGIDQKLAESFGMDKPQGALVTQVIPDSPAQESGLKQGDVILSYNGRKLTKSRDLPPLVAISPIGSQAELLVLRAGRKQTVTVRIGNLETATGRVLAADMNSWGMQLKSLDDDAREALRFDGDGGVLVAKVKPASAAARSGLHAGDILLAVGGESVTTPAAANKLLGSAKRKRPLPILFYRRGTTIFLALVPDKG